MKFRSERLNILQQEKSGKELSPEELALTESLETTYQSKINGLLKNTNSIQEEIDILSLKNSRALYLKKKYQEDAPRYLTFHWLTDSTPPQTIDKLDFPKEDSVESWANSL